MSALHCSYMELNRRDFLVVPAATMATSLFAADATVPWQRQIRRVGQTNMTEHDPVVLDVEQWADYWASLKVDAVLVSVTGILAFYQTKVPFHRKGKFLGDRDFFGDCCAAAKKRGIHVIARMSPDLNWEDAVQAHPEWFQRDAQGNAVHHTEDRPAVPHLHVLHLHDRLHAGHHARDQLAVRRGRPCSPTPGRRWARCRSAIANSAGTCRRPGPSTYWDKFNERTIYLWKLYDSIAKEKKPANFYFANLGGGIRCYGRPGEAGRDLRVVPVRQPGPRRRRYADLGLRAAGPRVQCRAEGQDGHQRHGRMVHRHAALAQRLQVAAGRADVVRRDAGIGHGAVSPHHRRRERDGRGPPLAGAGAEVLPTGWRGTTPTSSTSGPSPTSAW